jgi:hypothetical protein
VGVVGLQKGIEFCSLSRHTESGLRRAAYLTATW